MSTSTAQPQFEKRVADLGRLLARRVASVVAAVPGNPQGPVNLAKAVGVDKVLASRVLRASTHRDPIAAMQMMPSPDLLRRLATAAGRKGVSTKLVRELEASVQDYDEMIRSEAGDRSGFEAILSSWLPESRGEFELRRKQAAYRAMSQLVGRSTDVHLATAIIHPSADGQHIDIVWITALLGLQRLRPGVAVKFASRRVGVPDGERAPRHPRNLDGIEAEGIDSLRLDAFCSSPPPPLLTTQVGEVIHYTLGDTGFGPKSKADLVYAEVNLNELPRYFPATPKRSRYVFAEVSTPANLLVLDALIHKDLLGASRPELFIYDTVLDGVASVNDRTRDASRLDLRETLEPLGAGLRTYRVSEMPTYLEMLEQSFAKLGWNPADVMGFRTRIDYPVYGSQVAIAFDTQTQP
jgi:hypothetical protein